MKEIVRLNISDLPALVDWLVTLPPKTLITAPPGGGKSLIAKLLVALDKPVLDMDMLGFRRKDHWTVPPSLLPSSMICVGTCNNILEIATSNVGGILRPEFRFEKIVVMQSPFDSWATAIEDRAEKEKDTPWGGAWAKMAASAEESYLEQMLNYEALAEMVSLVSKSEVFIISLPLLPSTGSGRSTGEDLVEILDSIKTGVVHKLDRGVVGKFRDPKSGKTIEVRAKKGEEAAAAMMRVRRRHGFKN